MFKDGLLKGKRILITGGGTGLGKEMAAKFLELGAELFICGRRKSVCDATAAELVDKHGGQVTSYGVDIRNAAAVDEMIEDIFRSGPLTGFGLLRICSEAIWSRSAASAASTLRASASTSSIWPSGITTAPEESANT